MRICDLPEDKIEIGMRVRSLLNYNRIGTIVETQAPTHERYWFIQWDGEDKPTSGFYFNDCECEVVT